MRKLLITIDTTKLKTKLVKLTPYEQSMIDNMEEDKVYTRRELAEKLGYLPSTVTYKVSDLIGFDMIRETKLVKCPVSGRHVKGIHKI